MVRNDLFLVCNDSMYYYLHWQVGKPFVSAKKVTHTRNGIHAVDAVLVVGTRHSMQYTVKVYIYGGGEIVISTKTSTPHTVCSMQ